MFNLCRRRKVTPKEGGEQGGHKQTPEEREAAKAQKVRGTAAWLMLFAVHPTTYCLFCHGDLHVVQPAILVPLYLMLRSISEICHIDVHWAAAAPAFKVCWP